jgi:hypothetical protein
MECKAAVGLVDSCYWQSAAPCSHIHVRRGATPGAASLAWLHNAASSQSLNIVGHAQVQLPIVLATRLWTLVVIPFRCRAGCIEVFRAHNGAIKLASKDAESDMRPVMARQ